MIWSLYRWTWQLESPLYIGMPPSGSLNRCRLYVPARALWGAVTAEIARATAGIGFPDYKKVGDQIRKHVRFTYLFPAAKDEDQWHAWLPRYERESGLTWQLEGGRSPGMPDRKFRMRLVSTRPSTAIDPASDTSAEGSLRETECINTMWRSHEGPPHGPVGLVGYVFLRNGTNLAGRLSALTTLFVGGDTRYGLGRIKLDAMVPAKVLFGSTVDLDREQPCVLTDRTLAHALASNGAPMCGAQEAIGGWDMSGEQQGLQISGPIWTPGSRIQEGDRALHFGIDEHGLWNLDGQSGPLGPSNGAPSS